MIVEATSADGTRVGCEVIGHGPPLLAVHGSVASRERWSGPVRDALAQRFRVYLMDRRGRGLSADEAPGRYALEREAEDIRALVQRIGAPTLVLAHSYGGACALEAAVDCPGIERMLVYEPAFADGGGAIFHEPALEEARLALAGGDRDGAVTLFYRRALELDEATVASLRATPVWEMRLAAVNTLPCEGEAANAYRLDPVGMARIAAPVRFLLGSETAPALRRATLAAHAAIPGSELRELAGHGHTAMDLDPDLFVAEVTDWLLVPTT